jgi:hypothetical protein
MKEMNQYEIKEALENVEQILQNVYIEVKRHNEGDNQMDFCTHPSISEKVARILLVSKRIEKIVFQD